MNKPKYICPNCQGDATPALGTKFFPFCSERCKLIDLGEWAAEKFRVPVSGNPDEQDDEDQL